MKPWLFGALLLACQPALAATATEPVKDQDLTRVAIELAQAKVHALVSLQADDADEGNARDVVAKLNDAEGRLATAKTKFDAYVKALGNGDQTAASASFGSMCLNLGGARVKVASALSLALQPPLDGLFSENKALFDKANQAVDVARQWSGCP